MHRNANGLTYHTPMLTKTKLKIDYIESTPFHRHPQIKMAAH